MADELYAEQAVLGAGMLGKAGHDGVIALDAEDFSQRKHQRIALAIKAMINRGEQPDPITTFAELESRGRETGPDAVTMSYLFDIQTGVTPHNGWFYAIEVRDRSRERIGRRAFHEAMDKFDMQGASAHMDQIMAAHREATEQIPPSLEDGDAEVPTIAQLFDKEFAHRDLVPGLLYRRDRVVITAAEGLMKSTVCTQWAIALAAGLDPWTGDQFGQGMRVLLIDTENDEEQTQHRYRWVGDRVDRFGGETGWGHRIHHQVRPEGLDLVGKDRLWFSKLIGRVSPDIVIMGPAYKLIGGAKTNDDAAILAFFAVIDEMRVKHDCAFMIEAHTGHAKDGEERSLRPFGSSVWMRWPEVGIGFRRNSQLDTGEKVAKIVDVVPWRGFRRSDSIWWPDQLKRGADNDLPWMPFFDGPVGTSPR